MHFPRSSSLLLLAFLVCGWGCRSGKSVPGGVGVPEVQELRYLTGTPGTVAIAELAEDLGYLSPIRLKYVGSTFSGPQDIQSVIAKTTDFGGAFTGSVIKLASAGAPVVAVIASAGIDSIQWSGYFALDGSPVRVPQDLLGRKVAMNTVGAHHEFMIREWLRRGGLSNDQVKKVTLVSLPPINGEQALRSGQVDLASLGGILRDKALERGGVHPVFRDVDLYGVANTSVTVFHRDFVEKNPNTVRKFVEAIARTIEWTKHTPPDTVKARFRNIILHRGRHENPDLIKYWHGNGVYSRGGLLTDRDFQLWIDGLILQGDLDSGKVKPAQLYTNEFNPYRDSAATAKR